MPYRRHIYTAAVAQCAVGLCGVPAAAAPIFSVNDLSGPTVTLNPAKFGLVGDIVTPGLTVTDGYNRVGRTYAPDRTYLDLFGPVILKFSAPVSGFVFDFIALPGRPDFRLDLLVLDASDNILENDQFTKFSAPAPYYLPSGIFGVSGVGGISRVAIGNSFGNNSMYVGKVTYSLATIPEPATWATTIVGFGAIGSAMRRRRRVNVGFAD